jgi:5-methylcytosine-specific restriction endonuclease McrA
MGDVSYVSHNIYMRGWRLRHLSRAREISVASSRKYRNKIREAVFEKYGRACVRCGNILYLQLDHVHPLARTQQERRSKGNTTQELVDALLFPRKYFQILCKSCNLKKRGL